MKNKSLIEMEKNLTPLSKTDEGLYKGGFAEVPVMTTNANLAGGDNIAWYLCQIICIENDCKPDATTTTTTKTTQSPV